MIIKYFFFFFFPQTKLGPFPFRKKILTPHQPPKNKKKKKKKKKTLIPPSKSGLSTKVP